MVKDMGRLLRQFIFSVNFPLIARVTPDSAAEKWVSTGEFGSDIA